MQTHFFSESLTRRALDQQELTQRRHAGHHGQLGMVADGGAARDIWTKPDGLNSSDSGRIPHVTTVRG